MVDKTKVQNQEKGVSNKKEILIDGNDMILGRLGSFVSKKLLLGYTIKIVNCKKIILIGTKSFLVKKYKAKLQNRVVKQGPYYSRLPCNIVKRSFRNMLPYKNKRGKEALLNLRCFNSVPSTLINSKKTLVENAKVNKSNIFKFIKIEELCKILGYKSNK